MTEADNYWMHFRPELFQWRFVTNASRSRCQNIRSIRTSGFVQLHSVNSIKVRQFHSINSIVIFMSFTCHSSVILASFSCHLSVISSTSGLIQSKLIDKLMVNLIRLIQLLLLSSQLNLIAG